VGGHNYCVSVFSLSDGERPKDTNAMKDIKELRDLKRELAVRYQATKYQVLEYAGH